MRRFVQMLFIITLTSSAFAQCPTQFRLSGSNVGKSWSEVTNSAWSGMLPRGWVDKGFHFYSRMRERGPENGITTPSELESEINRRISDRAARGSRVRRQITLNIKNKKNESLKIIYDYAGRRTSKCELVTMSF